MNKCNLKKDENWKKIIVADMDPLSRRNLKSILENAGYEVVACYDNGPDVIHGCRRYRPAVVLIDVNMPLMEGITASQYVRACGLAPVVILMAVQNDLRRIAQDAACGLFGFVLKPDVQTMLIPTLQIAAARGKELDMLRQQMRETKNELEERKLIERAKGKLMCRRGLSEQDAYDYIRNSSKNNRISMRAAAEVIVHGENFTPNLLP